MFHAYCACGETEIVGDAKPVTSFICYCDDCQAVAKLIEAMPGHSGMAADGGTASTAFAKKRVRVVRGKLIDHKLRPESKSTRMLSACCKSNMCTRFADWMPMIVVRTHSKTVSSPRYCMNTKFAPGPIAHALPKHAGVPIIIPVKVLGMVLLRPLLLLLALMLAYLFLAPTPIEPVAWTPPAVTVIAENDRAKATEWLAKDLPGPEAIVFDSEGRIITGTRDGRIVRVSGGKSETLVNTGGRPLGVAFHPDGRLIICDAHKGLLAWSPEKGIETLATEAEGERFAFADDLAIAKNGIIYFTDASTHFGVEDYQLDILDHRPSGRVLAYDPATKQTKVLARELAFANGITLGPNEEYLVVCEMASYRLWRIGLDGKKRIFTDSVPGFPDNLRYSPESHVYWVAIGSPRDPLVDALAGTPWARKVIARLPKALLPKPKRHTFVLAVNEDGSIKETLQFKDPTSYSPVASVLEHDGALYLGSFLQGGYARLRLQ